MPIPDAHTPRVRAGALPAPLLWALAASAALHMAFVAMPLGAPGNRPSAAVNPKVAIQALLVPAAAPVPDAAAEQPVAAAVGVEPVPVELEQQAAPVPDQKVAVVATGQAPSPALGAGGATDVRVDGQPLADMDRLGELRSRHMSEFPVEIQFPVKLKEALRARYPPAALAAGREDSVAVWIVVDVAGAVEEVTVTEGTEEFANEVLAAIKDMQFVPAWNYRQPIRYPLALEFRFAINAAQLASVPSSVK